MADNALTCAVISGNADFRNALANVIQEQSRPVDIVVDVQSACGDLGADGLNELYATDAQVVIADFGDDPAASLRFIRLLSDAKPGSHFVGTGPELSQEILLQAMRAGVSEYLPVPVEDHDLAEAFHRVGRKLGHGGEHGRTNGRLLTFFSVKGGVGLTTAAANLATHLHSLTGRSVLLLDLDLEFGSTAVVTGVRARYSLLDLVENFHRIDEGLLNSLVEKHSSGVHVLSAPLEIPRSTNITRAQAETIFRVLRQHYDFVIADAARGTSNLAIAALEHADESFMLLTPDISALRNAKRLMTLLDPVFRTQGSKPTVILSLADGTEEVNATDVRDAISMDVSRTLRRDDLAVQRSVNVGVPIVLNGSRSRYSKDMKDMAHAVAAEYAPGSLPPEPGVADRLRNIFSRSSPEPKKAPARSSATPDNTE